MSSRTTDSDTQEETFDFAALLEQSFESLEQVRRGDLLNGTILAIDDMGIIIDVGLKRDAVLKHTEYQDIEDDYDFTIGQKITVMVTDTEDRDGQLIVSIKQARAQKDWDAATEHMDADEVYKGRVIAANRGGLIIPFGELRGFVPASHVVDMPRGLDDEERVGHLTQYVGKDITVKIIEVNPQRRRLVFSQRQAQRERREAIKEDLLDNLSEGDVIKGRVSSLRDFGAFIDLGGADGLIHISELAWRRITSPSEVVSVGDEIDVYVLQLDQEGKRIGLSLKRLKANPWEEIAETYTVGQTVEGRVSRVVSFGAFVELEDGIEALLHLSQMADPAPETPEEIIMPGDFIQTKIVSLEPDRQRIGLTLLNVEAPVEEAVAE